MTRGELTQLLHRPHLIGEKEINSLDRLIARYPYCQTFHILKTKGMHNVQSLGYMDQLKLTAITVSDRKNLYELIMRESLLKQIEEVESASDKIPEIPVKNDLKVAEPEIEMVSVEPIKTVEAVPEIKEMMAEKKEINFTDELKEKIKIEPYIVPEIPIYLKEETKVSLPHADLTSRIEKSVPLEEAKVEEIKFEIKNEEKEKPEEKIVEEQPSVAEINTKKISGLEQEILYEAINKSIQTEVWNDIVEENPEVLKPKEEVSPIVSLDPQQPKDFFGWLHLTDPLQKEKIKVEPKPEPAEEKEHPSVIPTGQVKNLDELIDKFIRNDPRITPSKAEFYSPTNIAKLSIVDKEEFVSETLAKIYEKQGYFDKAIKVYNKLSLKFPEKNSYFASLIEKAELQKAIEKQKKQK